ncbi:MAG: DoxX family protein [Deltaproteobacteria bacterium]
MLKGLLKTSGSVMDMLLRLTLAAVFFPHGAQKVLGWFGGYGLAGTYAFFTQKAGIPGVFAALAIIAEFLGPIGLFSGFLTRVAAFGIFCNMAVAIWLVHAKVGFFMNWYGTMPAGKEGFEYHILAIALCIAVMVRGGGALSVDRMLAGRRRRDRSLPP